MTEKIIQPTKKIPEKTGADTEKLPNISEKIDIILQNNSTSNNTRHIGQRGKDKTKRKVSPKSLANLRQNSLKKEKRRQSSSQDVIDTKEIISNPTITKEITNNIVTSKQDNTNFEDFTQEDKIISYVTQEEDYDSCESNDNETIESSSSITTQGISVLVLLSSFGRGAVIIIALGVLGLVAYMLYKKWKQARDEQTENDEA